jgi:hypothetical protein
MAPVGPSGLDRAFGMGKKRKKRFWTEMDKENRHLAEDLKFNSRI